ncbi:hypothetical protein ACQKWADRAFT_223505 [Trichoderma austrokoningii]
MAAGSICARLLFSPWSRFGHHIKDLGRKRMMLIRLVRRRHSIGTCQYRQHSDYLSHLCQSIDSAYLLGDDAVPFHIANVVRPTQTRLTAGYYGASVIRDPPLDLSRGPQRSCHARWIAILSTDSSIASPSRLVLTEHVSVISYSLVMSIVEQTCFTIARGEGQLPTLYCVYLLGQTTQYDPSHTPPSPEHPCFKALLLFFCFSFYPICFAPALC